MLHIYAITSDELKSRVFEKSVQVNMPDARLNLIEVEWIGHDLSQKPGGGQKVMHLRKHLLDDFDNGHVEDHDVILFCDSYDVIVNDSVDTLIERYYDSAKSLLFAGENVCWPDLDVQDQQLELYSNSGFVGSPYLNSGLFIGNARFLKSFLKGADIAIEDDDQLFYQKEFLKNPVQIGIDYESYVFQCLANTDENEVLLNAHGQINNIKTNCTSTIIHANGGSTNHPVYQKLKKKYVYEQPEVLYPNVDIFYNNANRINQQYENKEFLLYNFLTREGCQEIIKACEEHGQWEEMYNDKFPGQEMRLKKALPELYEKLSKRFMDHIVKDAEQHWRPLLVQGIRDMFVIKYSEDGQKSLPLHHDASLITGSIKLNEDYTGADLYFPRQDITNHVAGVGECLVWPSSVTHGHMCRELKSGTKYSLTIWTSRYAGDIN